MESWLAALKFPTAFKEKLLRMALDPTQQEAVRKASITFQSSTLTCANRHKILGLAAEHTAMCGAGCTTPCVIKICSGSSKTTQIGAPNDAALTNRFRPMIVCTDFKHNAFELPPKTEGGREPKCMTYIYLDIWYMEKILQWHYQQGWSTEDIETDLKKPKYKLELALIHRWRASQGIYNPKMWDFPQDFDKDIQDMSNEIQKEMTENVKKKQGTMVKAMRESALEAHATNKVVFQAQSGQKRLSMMTSAEQERYKRPRSDKSPGLGTHVDSNKGYASDRTSAALDRVSALKYPPMAAAPFQGGWHEKYPEHEDLSATPEGKGGKGKTGKKGKGKGKSKGKSTGKGKQAYSRDSWYLYW